MNQLPEFYVSEADFLNRICSFMGSDSHRLDYRPKIKHIEENCDKRYVYEICF